MPMLLVGRGISGVGAAGLLSIVRLILSDSASIDDINTQGAAMVATYTVGYWVGPILGGGLLQASWRWVFGINLPVGAASMLIVWILIRNHTKGHNHLQASRGYPLMLQKTSKTRITDAMISMTMLRSYEIVATDFATMASGMIMLCIFYFVAIFYVIVNGSNAVSAGSQPLRFSLGMGISAVISIQLIKRLRQPKISIVLGSIVLPIGVGFLTQALYESNPRHIKTWLIVSGAGVGLTFGPFSYQARCSHPKDRLTIVVDSNLFFRSFSGTIGPAQLSEVMYSRV